MSRSRYLWLIFYALAYPAAHAFEVRLPAKAEMTLIQDKPNVGLLFPNSAWIEGASSALAAEGAQTLQVWRVPSRTLSTAELIDDLAKQVAANGFERLFQCQTVICGGFDFRFQVPGAGEPHMHVNLNDFQYFLGRKDDQILSLLVSRSDEATYVQVLGLGAAGSVALVAPPVENPPDPGDVTPPPDPIEPDPEPTTQTAETAPPAPATRGSDLNRDLSNGGPVVLRDLRFTPGTAELEPGTLAAITALGQWLEQNPAARVMIVGHSDASGSIDSNQRLSQSRAEAVVSALRRDFPDLDPARLAFGGAGALAPIATNLTPEGKAQNRRVEVFVMP